MSGNNDFPKQEFRKHWSEQTHLLEKLSDIFDELLRLNLMKDRKVQIGKTPAIKISLHKSMRTGRYSWEIEIQSDLDKYTDLIVLLETTNKVLREKFGETKQKGE